MPLRVVEAGALRRVDLLVPSPALIPRQRDQIAVDPLEIAIDALLGDDPLDAVDRGAVALGGKPRTRTPNSDCNSEKRSSSTAVKCAVVRPVSPAARPKASTTTTDRPSFCSK